MEIYLSLIHGVVTNVDNWSRVGLGRPDGDKQTEIWSHTHETYGGGVCGGSPLRSCVCLWFTLQTDVQAPLCHQAGVAVGGSSRPDTWPGKRGREQSCRLIWESERESLFIHARVTSSKASTERTRARACQKVAVNVCHLSLYLACLCQSLIT